MSIEILDVEKVGALIKLRGWKRTYVNQQLNLGTEGYKFLRGEWMPKDQARKAKILKQLAKMLGVEVPQILLRLEARRAG